MTRRVLVADDDDFVRRFLEHLLVLQGFLVDLVPNGREALDLVACEEYSILILDHQMGDPTGLDVARTLRAEGMETPILLMSSDPMAEDAAKVVGVRCLEKPFSGAELTAAIEEIARKGAR